MQDGRLHDTVRIGDPAQTAGFFMGCNLNLEASDDVRHHPHAVYRVVRLRARGGGNQLDKGHHHRPATSPRSLVLFGQLHEVLAETGGTRRDNCKSRARLQLRVTVEIQDIRRASYFKYPAGTLTPQ